MPLKNAKNLQANSLITYFKLNSNIPVQLEAFQQQLYIVLYSDLNNLSDACFSPASQFPLFCPNVIAPPFFALRLAIATPIGKNESVMLLRASPEWSPANACH